MSRRVKRVETLIRDELATLLLEQVSDPAVAGLAVASVRLTGDLSIATVKLFYPKDGDLKALEKGLKRVTPYLRRQLGERLALRLVPELHFEPETETEAVVRVLGILDGLGGSRGEVNG